RSGLRESRPVLVYRETRQDLPREAGAVQASRPAVQSLPPGARATNNDAGVYPFLFPARHGSTVHCLERASVNTMHCQWMIIARPAAMRQMPFQVDWRSFAINAGCAAETCRR